MRTAAIIVANTEDADPTADPWAVLETALAALARLAPRLDVVVGWAGACAPVVADQAQRLVELPPMCSDWEARFHLADELVDTERLVLLAADAVIGPDTIETLLADHDTAVASGRRIGFVAASSDLATPTQLGRPGASAGSEQAVLSRIELTAVAIERNLLLSLSAPLDDTLGDAFLSWELALAGFEHRLSRAYVHRLGPAHASTWGDASGAVPAELTERLRFFRPDLFEQLVSTPLAPGRPTPEEERADPASCALRWRSLGDDLDHRVGVARCLRWQGRTIEAVDALGEFDLDDLNDDDARFVAELAWLIGDQGSAIEIGMSRPSMSEMGDEFNRLSSTYVELMDDVESRGLPAL